MKKILVCGAGGYVGIPLCEKLITKGYEVIALDRYFFGIEKIEKIKISNLTIIKDDIRYFNEKLLEGVEVVIDLCGLSNDATSEINEKFTQEINFEGSVRLSNLSKKIGVKHYLYSSSASVYGYNENKLLRETDKLNPITNYAKSKVFLENHLTKIQDENFKITILRNSTIYGLSQRMRFDLAVNIMTLSGTKDKIIYIMGDGKQWRPFVHVKDVVKAFIMCLENPSLSYGETFNVGSNDQNYNIKDLAEIIKNELKDCKIIHIPNNPDNRSYNLEFNKIETKLNFKCDYNINDGVKEINKNLKSGILDSSDETFHTLNWYKKLLEWDLIINSVKLYDKIL